VQQQPGREREGTRVEQADADSAPDKTLRREGACGQHGRGEHQHSLHSLQWTCKCGPFFEGHDTGPSMIMDHMQSRKMEKLACLAVLALVGESLKIVRAGGGPGGSSVRARRGGGVRSFRAPFFLETTCRLAPFF